jgi:hypothetical protein
MHGPGAATTIPVADEEAAPVLLEVLGATLAVLHRAQRPGQGSRLADGDVDPDQPTVMGELACPAPRLRLLDAFIGQEAHQSAPLHLDLPPEAGHLP